MKAFADVLGSAPKNVLIVGGENLTVEIEAAEDGKSVKMEVKKEPVGDKDESTGMVVPDKTKLVTLLESTSRKKRRALL